MTRLLFATDVHGSEKCWRKFINAGTFKNVDVLVLGGDITGKVIVPIFQKGNHKWESDFLETKYALNGEEELREHEKIIRYQGFYPYQTNQKEFDDINADKEKLDRLFNQVMNETFKEWLRFADERLRNSKIRVFLAPGNDDRLEVDSAFEVSERCLNAEGKVVMIDEYHEMISTGYSNPTPWKTFREESEEDLAKRLESYVKQLANIPNSIFAFHAPPFDSTLDLAPELDENFRPVEGGSKLIPVGSTAVREAITKYQPLLGLHGHIHECSGSFEFSRTLCINPGSQYTEGILCGIIVEFEKDKIKKWTSFSG